MPLLASGEPEAGGAGEVESGCYPTLPASTASSPVGPHAIANASGSVPEGILHADTVEVRGCVEIFG
jgi:hypothetical protein